MRPRTIVIIGVIIIIVIAASLYASRGAGGIDIEFPWDEDEPAKTGSIHIQLTVVCDDGSEKIIGQEFKLLPQTIIYDGCVVDTFDYRATITDASVLSGSVNLYLDGRGIASEQFTGDFKFFVPASTISAEPGTTPTAFWKLTMEYGISGGGIGTLTITYPQIDLIIIDDETECFRNICPFSIGNIDDSPIVAGGA